MENDKAAKLKVLRLRAEQLIRESPGEFKDTPAEDIQSVILTSLALLIILSIPIAEVTIGFFL